MLAYFDMFSGISGDMTLGALLDLGVPLPWLKDQLTSLPLSGFDLRVETVFRNGLKAVNLFVDVDQGAPSRDYQAIQNLLINSELPDRVKGLSLEAFSRLAKAEAGIHGTPVEKVHFHEVGGVDAIVDIVGAFLCVDYLDISRVAGSVIPLGSGKVLCSHGLLPVPAPATVALLKGVPVIASESARENVTPTGAAIITTLAQEFGGLPDMVIEGVGYGSGKRIARSGLPNLLRIILGNSPKGMIADKTNDETEQVAVIETSIDDMIPELSGYLMEKLFEAGALDVCHIPVQMKKNRPGIRLEVVCRELDRNKMIDLILTQSTSIGVRYQRMERRCLKRRQVVVDTRFGPVVAKAITDPSGSVRIMPEYEACKEVAETRKIALKDVYTQLYLDMNQSRL